jgi:hypothetical protein
MAERRFLQSSVGQKLYLDSMTHTVSKMVKNLLSGGRPGLIANLLEIMVSGSCLVYS